MLVSNLQKYETLLPFHEHVIKLLWEISFTGETWFLTRRLLSDTLKANFDVHNDTVQSFTFSMNN